MSKRSKSSVLRRAADFALVKKEGIRARSGPISLSFFACGGRQRLGVILTRHVGVAVERNRIRRIVREYFRVNGELLPEGDYVVIPREGSSSLSNEELRGRISSGLQRIGQKMHRGD